MACIDADALAIAGPCGEADWYVYATEEDRDADADGSRAMAIIVSKASFDAEASTGLFDE